MSSQSQTAATQSSEMWEILEILQETKDQYFVAWAGIDPDTGKPWEPGWTDKPLEHAPEILAAWEEKQAAAKAEKAATRRKSKRRSGEGNDPPKTTQKRKRDMGDTRRDTSETTKRTRSASTDVSHKTFSAGSPSLDSGPSRHAKRRRIGSSVEPLIACSSNMIVDIEGCSSQEVIPETQPSVQDAQESPRASSSKSSPSTDTNTTLHQKVANSINLVKIRGSVVGPRKSNISASKTVLRKGPLKPQRPVPVVPPSFFNPYLPTQDPIEDFSSPERSRKKQTMSDTIQESLGTPSVPQEGSALLGVQYTNRADAFVQTACQASSIDHAVSWPAEQSNLMHLPSTASTQLADIDTQSQVIYIPVSQASDDEEKLLVKAEVVNLHSQLSRLEEDLEGALLQNGEADMQVLRLKGELEACQKAQASLLPEAQFLEQAEALSLAQQQVIELQEVLACVQDTARQSWEKISKEHVQKLQEEVHRWKGMHEVLVKRDQKMDDNMRRKAAEHSELIAHINNLENAALAQLLDEQQQQQQLKMQHEQLLKTSLVQGDLNALQQEYKALESEMNNLQSEHALLIRAKVQLGDLLASCDEASKSQSPDLYVCRYVTYGEPCHGLFFSATDAQHHALKTHYSFNNESLVE
ncbi:hypothetical protein BDY19DRAFT_966011 [Irpex rosettiformis]|uniref:Uncharacterized protein n=1 Tax=Irpex rosettiformis TaxID=378272 RepID=A0ACB8TTL9_9APHY|nr:hypothetical protein BDY19DRAFT_966011 [Irpex rosettiformis]